MSRDHAIALQPGQQSETLSQEKKSSESTGYILKFGWKERKFKINLKAKTLSYITCKCHYINTGMSNISKTKCLGGLKLLKIS